MSRVRISTTVDGDRLARLRALRHVSDSQLVDEAFAALLEALETQQELEALEAQPFEDDDDLAWEAPPGPSLPYEGHVPADVVELARRRRSGP